jgi:hypothetical protein
MGLRFVPEGMRSPGIVAHGALPMKRYHPLTAPNSADWLDLDESERIDLVIDFHRRTGVRLPNERVHAVFHVIVENQVLLGDEMPVAETLDRLMEEGLDRHEAIHAVGSVLAEHLWKLTKDKGGGRPDPNIEYYKELRKFSAKKWFERYK